METLNTIRLTVCTNPERFVRVRIFEVQVILGFLAELRCSYVHSNLNLACIASFLNCLLQQFQAYNIINNNRT